MTRAGYFKALTKAIRGYTIVEAAVILARCDRQFQNGLAAGYGEEEICAALVMPEVLARRLRPGRRFAPSLRVSERLTRAT